VHLFEQALGPEHPNVAVMLNTLASLFRAKGQYEQAQLLYQRALVIQEQALGPEHYRLVYSLCGLALLSQDQDEYIAAESFYQRALSLQEKHLGHTHPAMAEILRDMAQLRRLQGRKSEACSLAERALAILSRSLGETHPQTIALRTLHAQLLSNRLICLLCQGCRNVYPSRPGTLRCEEEQSNGHIPALCACVKSPLPVLSVDRR
jgi:tetratricopeptide (TPR) repeat protein